MMRTTKAVIYHDGDMDGVVGAELLRQFRYSTTDMREVRGGIVPPPDAMDGVFSPYEMADAGWDIVCVDCRPEGWVMDPAVVFDHHPPREPAPSAARLVYEALESEMRTPLLESVDWLTDMVSQADCRVGGRVDDAIAFVQGVRAYYGPPTLEVARQLLLACHQNPEEWNGCWAVPSAFSFLITLGRRVMSAETEAAKSEVADGREVEIGGRVVWAVNRPVSPPRDAAACAMGHPTRLFYWAVGSQWQLSFRGDGARDCAVLFGGGGHDRAAGARVVSIPEIIAGVRVDG